MDGGAGVCTIDSLAFDDLSVPVMLCCVYIHMLGMCASKRPPCSLDGGSVGSVTEGA